MLSVLIESDWNLKFLIIIMRRQLAGVLIESDWNLKEIDAQFQLSQLHSINRIRLEFKVISAFQNIQLIIVLIESDWNLK